MDSLLVNNLGMADRVIRVLLGISMLALIFVGPQTWFGLVGLVPLVTGVAGYCPIYHLFGLSTCPLEPEA